MRRFELTHVLLPEAGEDKATAVLVVDRGFLDVEPGEQAITDNVTQERVDGFVDALLSLSCAQTAQPVLIHSLCTDLGSRVTFTRASPTFE